MILGTGFWLKAFRRKRCFNSKALNGILISSDREGRILAPERRMAHFAFGDAETLRRHGLEEPLRSVGDLTLEFAEAFHGQGLAHPAGLWQDQGKYGQAFQEMLAKAAALGPDAAREGPSGADHSTAGALWASRRLGDLGTLLAFAVAGHHPGLPDFSDANGSPVLPSGPSATERPLRAPSFCGHVDHEVQRRLALSLLEWYLG